MQNGVVKWFNNAKGYGFILGEDGESNIFVHYSSIEMSGYKTLKAGQEVTFEAEPGPKGLHVTKVELPNNIINPISQQPKQPTIGFTQADQAATRVSDENRDMYEF